MTGNLVPLPVRLIIAGPTVWSQRPFGPDDMKPTERLHSPAIRRFVAVGILYDDRPGDDADS